LLIIIISIIINYDNLNLFGRLLETEREREREREKSRFGDIENQEMGVYNVPNPNQPYDRTEQ
jgi:hypothetical protein